MTKPWSERSVDCVVPQEILVGIDGRELLAQHLGYWPTFHDFEIISISLERAPWLTTATCDLRANFYGFDIKEVPDSPNRKQVLAEILFEQIDGLKIDGFNHQNPIMGISITRPETDGPAARFLVEWGGTCLQHDVSFTCTRISVIRVVSLNPFHKSIPA